MIFIFSLLLAVSAHPEECHEIDHTTVRAADLAPLLPSFAELPRDFLLGYIPESGAPHVFEAADLARIARNRGVELTTTKDVCMARRRFVPQLEQVLEAMRSALGSAGLRIEIASLSSRSVPTGTIVFPRSGVQGPGPEVTWYGYVQTAEGTKFPVSARAKVTVVASCVVAAADLKVRLPIEAGQIRLESCESSPFDEASVSELDDAIGLLPKMAVKKGAHLLKSQVQRPMDVAFGDLVRVDVFEGAAHLTLTARAEAAGVKGSLITVRNLASGQSFRAEVTGKNRVIVGGHAD